MPGPGGGGHGGGGHRGGGGPGMGGRPGGHMGGHTPPPRRHFGSWGHGAHRRPYGYNRGCCGCLGPMVVGIAAVVFAIAMLIF